MQHEQQNQEEKLYHVPGVLAYPTDSRDLLLEFARKVGGMFGTLAMATESYRDRCLHHAATAGHDLARSVERELSGYPMRPDEEDAARRKQEDRLANADALDDPEDRAVIEERLEAMAAQHAAGAK